MKTKQNLFFYIAICIIFISCSSNKPQVPASIIQPDKMQPILTDLHMVEGKLILLKAPQDSLKKAAHIYYASVYEKHDITHKEFSKSFDWYQEHPELMMEFYDLIIERLEEAEAKVEQDKRSHPKPDSLQKSKESKPRKRP